MDVFIDTHILEFLTISPCIKVYNFKNIIEPNNLLN